MVLFMRGEFDQAQVVQVSYALFAYLAGLMSFMVIKVLAPGYYSRQDTKTPVKIGIIAMVANMVFNLMLAPFYGYVGLAIATTLSASLNAFLLYRGLKKLGVYHMSAAAKFAVVKLLVAASIMATILYFLSPPLIEWFEYGFIESVVRLSLYILLGAIAFFICTYLGGFRLSDFKVQQAEPS